MNQQDRYFVQICPHDSPPFGELCQAYAESAEMAGFETVTTFLSKPTAEPLDNAIYLKADNVKSARRISQALKAQLPKGLDDTKLSVVLCHRYRSLKVALWAGLPKRKTVCLAHEYGLFDSNMRRWLRPLFAKHVHFAGVSNDVAKELAGITDYHMVLPNVLTQKTHLSREDARAELGLSDDAVVIGVVGRLHYKKRPKKALEAVQALRESTPNAELVFLGDGDRDLLGDIPGWVHLPGNIPNASRYMKAFDVLLHVGDVESFGMVILEAMAAGTPSVVGRFAGPEYVLGDLGYYAEQDDPTSFSSALQDALSNNDTEGWADQARERIDKKFSVAVTSKRIAALAEFVAEDENVGVGDFSF